MPADVPEIPAPATPKSDRARSFFARNSASQNQQDVPQVEEQKEENGKPTRWSMGVLNDPNTHEVPGSVLLLTGHRNEPLGLRNAPARTSHGSLPAQPISQRLQSLTVKKTTKDGQIILEPQPDDSINDPLNWPTWRRDAALLSLGLYCMVGGGITPILAAGFTNVAATFDVTTPQVALTTGLYMMGLGVGSVIASPTAILYGKRPVYLFSAIAFICTSIWCAASSSYTSLVVARVFQGISVSPVECLPSATVAEIFFLHERAYRLGIYTLLLLGGKNLVPLVSAAIIQSYGWRWVFWIVAMVVAFCGGLLFFLVPESFWDRSPVPKSRKTGKSGGLFSRFSGKKNQEMDSSQDKKAASENDNSEREDIPISQEVEHNTQGQEAAVVQRHNARGLHVGFASEANQSEHEHASKTDDAVVQNREHTGSLAGLMSFDKPETYDTAFTKRFGTMPRPQDNIQSESVPAVPDIRNFNSPWYQDPERKDSDYLAAGNARDKSEELDGRSPEQILSNTAEYTAGLKDRPRMTFIQQLKPYNGRLHYDNWFKVALRPFVLFAYPAVLWSAVVYSCSVGWLIVLSESVAVTYRSKQTYGFSALSTGLIYISPFIGGVLGTAVAGKVSDIIVKAMSRRNGGLYEPEFRLVMAIPITITTVIGLMGFGWSAQEHDAWIVPTLFFGIISFGCSLGSTTAITFCVDSYRQYAGEALVTLNFSKNIFHGLVFSLFFNTWLEADGSKIVFIWLGVIQLILMMFSIPMYVFGKRARMWTVRMNFMEKF